MGLPDLQAAIGGPPGGGAPTLDVPSMAEEAGGGAPPDQGGGGSSLDSLDAAEEALTEFIRLDPDEVDRAEAGKALQIVLKLKASNQQSVEAGDMKSLKRALGPPGA